MARSASHTPDIHFQPRAFHPASWLPGPHFQTIGGKFLRPRPDLGAERLTIETPDGDFLDLDLGPDPGEDAPVVVVLHGLEGSTARSYMKVAMWEITRRGMRAIGMNFRSCSGRPNRLPRFYHSGDTGDLAFLLEVLGDRFPDRRLGAMGFSLGGNVLLRYLGDVSTGAPAELRAAVAISVPFDLREGTRRLEERRMGRVYTHYFLRSLRRKALAKQEILGDVLDLERVMAARTLREFDDAATAPLHGFRDAWEYYELASSAPVLPRIRVPTLLLHALDDPFLPPEAVPVDAARESPWLLGVFPPLGGHVGFVEDGSPLHPRFWAESEGARYLSEALDAPGANDATAAGTAAEDAGDASEGTSGGVRGGSAGASSRGPEAPNAPA